MLIDYHLTNIFQKYLINKIHGAAQKSIHPVIKIRNFCPILLKLRQFNLTTYELIRTKFHNFRVKIVDFYL